VEHLARPERGDDVRLASPTGYTDPIGERPRKVRALGVEGSGHFLKVGKARPVFDMQQGKRVNAPSNQIRTSCELIVLIWLVDPDLEASRP